MLSRLPNRRCFSLVLAAVLSTALAAPAWAQDEEPEFEDKRDEDQPAVTAGGLYGLDTYPRSEHARTLTLPQGILELIAELHIDLTESVAFETFVPVIGVRYGISDSFQLEAGAAFSFSSADDMVLSKTGGGPSGGVAAGDSIGVFAAAEIALAYDLVDVRLGVNIPVDPEFLFDIVVGFPVKFRVNDKIAILGLEELLIIHTGDGDGIDGTDKPDLNLSVAGLYQVIEPLAVVVRASLFVEEFKFSDKRKLPVDLDVIYAISNQFDLGIGVSLTNLAPPENQGSPTDSRAFRIWGRFRI